MKNTYILLLLLLSYYPVFSQNLSNYKISFIEDKEKKYDINQILLLDSANKFTSLSNKDLSFGFTKSDFWLKVEVASEQTDWLLVISNPYLPEVALYYLDNRNQWTHFTMGAAYPFVARPIDHRFLVLPLSLRKNVTNTFYLKTNSRGDALNIPMEIQQSNAFYAKSSQTEMGYGIFFGILFFVLVNNAFLYISLRERSYFLYVMYIVFIGLTNAYISGHIFQYLFAYLPFPSLHFYTLPYFIFFTHIFGTLFSLEFLHIRAYLKGFYRFINVVLVLNILAFSAFFITSETNILIFAHLFGVVLLISAFVSGFLVWRKGNIAARYYVVAYILLFAGSLLFILRNAGVLPEFYVAVHGLELGILAEAIMLSVALADKNGIQKRNANMELENKVTERTLQIANANKEIEKALKEIEEKNKDITASITYAKRIQGALLPGLEVLTQIFPRSFVLYKPRDIVSGDFYWFEKLETVAGKNYLMAAVADCTGHGVPGAFMSMIGNTLLNEIVLEKKILMPHLVLDELHLEIQKALKQKEGSNQDGMDISLCLFDLDEKKCYFAGAKGTLYYIQSEQLYQIRGNNFSIGGSMRAEEQFTLQVIDYQTPTQIFLCSDGFQDQFGGPTNKKFSTLRLRELFVKASAMDADQQLNLIEEQLENWMSYVNHVQVDDILVLGIQTS